MNPSYSGEPFCSGGLGKSGFIRGQNKAAVAGFKITG